MCNDCQISLLYSLSTLIYTLNKSINIGAQSWKKVPWLLQMIMFEASYCVWAQQRSRYSYWLWAGRSGDQILVEARFSAPVQTSPGAHPASCTMGTRSFLGVKSGRGVTLTPHPFQCCDKERVEPYFSFWAVRPVQSLSACTRVHFIFFYSYSVPTVVCTYSSSVRYLPTHNAGSQ